MVEFFLQKSHFELKMLCSFFLFDFHANVLCANWFVYIPHILMNAQIGKIINESRASRMPANKQCNGCGIAMVLSVCSLLILHQCELQSEFFAHYSQMPNVVRCTQRPYT